MNTEAVRIIRQEIDRIPGRKRVAGGDVNILCPYHSENTPSCGIVVVEGGRVPVGTWNCLGCGEHGNWNRLAERLNLRKITGGNTAVTEVTANPEARERRRGELLPSRTTGVEIPYGIEYDEDEWRGISGDLVRAVGAVLGFDPAMRRSALYFPVRVRGRLVTTIKAALEKRRGVLSYVVASAGEGVLKRRALFPYDHVALMLGTGAYQNVLLVEGPRDALFLCDHQIPALAILGTKMWSPEKQRLVNHLCDRHGVEPIIMMDADPPGRTDGKRPGQMAQAEILRSYRDSGRPVAGIPLGKYARELGLPALDPATLPRPLVRKIRRLVRRQK